MRSTLFDQRKGASAQKPLEVGGLTFSLTMFEHARNHMHLHRTLVGNRGGTIVFDAIRQMLSDLVRAELSPDLLKNKKDAVPREIVVQFVVGAYMAVTTWWLDHGEKLAPERMDAIFQRLANKGIANLH